jgi:hypothetical protein
MKWKVELFLELFDCSYRVSLSGFFNVVSGDDDRSSVIGAQSN